MSKPKQLLTTHFAEYMNNTEQNSIPMLIALNLEL
jgi:hypothetical protein